MQLLLLLLPLAHCAILPEGHRDATEEWGLWSSKEGKIPYVTEANYSRNHNQASPFKPASTMKPQVVNNIFSASFDGAFYNNNCKGLIQLTDDTVPVDTPNKAVSFWFYATGWPNQWPILYDTTNTRGTPSYGHTIYCVQQTPGSSSSTGQITLCDWVGNCLAMGGWG